MFREEKMDNLLPTESIVAPDGDVLLGELLRGNNIYRSEIAENHTAIRIKRICGIR